MPSILLCFFLLLCAVPSQAAPTVTCHCFQDRAFDPQRPTAADDYFLAAAQNALFAAVSGDDKKSVVRAKMGGADGAELWVSWYLATQGGVGRDAVAAARNGGADWRQVVQQLAISPECLAPPVLQGVLRNASTVELASTVVDTVLREHCRIAVTTVHSLRQQGAGDRETILALVLAQGPQAVEYWQAVKAGRQSWGSLLQQAGLSAENLEARVRRLPGSKRD